MRWLLPLLLISNGLVAEAQPERVLLVVANNQGAETEQTLRWAEADAQDFVTLMQDLGSVSQENTFLSLGKKSERVADALDLAAERLTEINEAGRNGELIVYIAGHADPKHLHLGNARFPLSELRAWFEATAATTRIMFVDTCFSGGVWERSESGGLRVVRRQPVTKGTVYITASAANEFAQESNDLGGAFFTSHLLSGLRGAADQDQDGRITLSEVYEHTYSRTVQDSFAQAPMAQHPQLRSDVNREGAMVLTVLERSEAALVVPATFSGRLLIVADRTERVVVDAVHVNSAKAVRYGVPAGRYRLLAKTADGVSASAVEVPAQTSVPLPRLEAVSDAAYQAVARGRLYDPEPIDWSLRLDLGWRWDESLPTDHGLVALSLGVELLFDDVAYLAPALSYARTVGSEGASLRSLDVVALEVDGGYAQEFRSWGLRAGARAAVALGIQRWGVPVVESTTAIYSFGPVLRLLLNLDLHWRLGLAINGGVLAFRANQQTELAGLLQVGLSLDYRF